MRTVSRASVLNCSPNWCTSCVQRRCGSTPARSSRSPPINDSSVSLCCFCFFFSSRRRHTRCLSDWSSDVCSSDLMHAMIEEGVDRMKTDAREEPLIAVGGGCFLVPERLPGVSDVVHVRHQAVANAVGAAIAQVSGEIDQIFQNLARDDAIAAAQRLAETRAMEAGAAGGTLKGVEVEDLPLAYLPGNSRRVRVRVVGDIR